MRIFVGDGLSDVCPALAADVVFAKDSLAAELARRGTPYRPFQSLTDVSKFLCALHGGASAKSRGAGDQYSIGAAKGK